MPTMGLAGRELYATVNTQVVEAMHELLGGTKPLGIKDLYTQVVPGMEGKKTLEANIASNSPVLRQWTGARQARKLRGFVHTAVTKKYEATLIIPASDYTSGSAAMITKRVSDMLTSAQNQGIEKIVYDFLHTTNGPTTYDNLAFFSTVHTFNGSPTGTGSNTGTTAFSAVQANAVDLVMTQLQNEDGRLLGINADTVRCGQKILPMVKEVFEADTRSQAVANDGLEAGTRVASAAVSNVFKGTKDVIMDPFITDSSYYFHDTKWSEKPVMMAYTRPFRVTNQIEAETSDFVFEHDAFRFGIDVEFVLLAVNWQMMNRNVVA
jgi:phage major head subunit gpT-like protein